MNIQLSTQNFDVTEPLREYVEEKIGHIGRGDTEINASAHVRISRDHHHKHGEVFTLSVHVTLPSRSFSAETHAGDPYAATDLAQEKLEHEFEHWIGRGESRRRRVARALSPRGVAHGMRKLGHIPQRQWRWIRNRLNNNHDEN